MIETTEHNDHPATSQDAVQVAVAKPRLKRRPPSESTRRWWKRGLRIGCSKKPFTGVRKDMIRFKGQLEEAYREAAGVPNGSEIPIAADTIIHAAMKFLCASLRCEMILERDWDALRPVERMACIEAAASWIAKRDAKVKELGIAPPTVKTPSDPWAQRINANGVYGASALQSDSNYSKPNEALEAEPESCQTGETQ